MIAVDQVQFSSEFNVDKIQTWSSAVDSSGIGAGFHLTVPANTSLPTLLEATGSLSNPYGKKGLPTITWSLDQQNWYPTGGQIIYFDPVHAQYTTQVAVYMAVTNSLITFVVTTGLNAPQTIYLQFAVDNPT